MKTEGAFNTMNQKILLICTSSGGVISFRFGLIKELLKNDYEVLVIADDSQRKTEIESLIGEGNFFDVGGENRSVNPLKILAYSRRLKIIIKQTKPDIVFTFQLKPNLFGVKQASNEKVNKIYSMIEGLGDVFIASSFKYKIYGLYVKYMYKKALSKVNNCFFLNSDDVSDFINMKLIKKEKVVKINGIGVNLDKFKYSEVVPNKSVLMIARLIKNKGIIEYCEAAEIVKKTHPECHFTLVGQESELKAKDLEKYTAVGTIEYLGTRTDIYDLLKINSIYVLPSHREGLPMSTMEALAVGRPVITSDVPGCRETVVEGYNGYIVKKGDAIDLADKIIKMINLSDEDIIMLCRNSRKLAEDKFDSKVINKRILDVLLNY